MNQLHNLQQRHDLPAEAPRESHLLADDLARVRTRMAALFERSADHSSADPALAEALTELQSAVEKLTVAQQEVHDQNQQLREAWSAMHTERIRYLSLFHSMPDAYFVTTAHGQIQEANEPAAKMLMRPISYLIGKPLAVYIPPGERELFRTSLAHCVATGASVTWETKLQPRRAMEVPIELRVMVAAAGVPNTPRLYWLMRDIRERREAEQKLVQAERLGAIGEMVAGLAHESRNALQRSQACLSMLALEVKDRPEAQELIDRLRGAQRRLVHLYEQVRVYAAPVRIEVDRVDIIKLLQEVLDDLLFVHPGRVLKLILSGSERRPPVASVDRVSMSQVFTNIIENSIAACTDPVMIAFDWSEVEISGKPMLRLEIRDNGPGLDEQVAARLFEPFFTTKTRGTGLGMSIVRRLVESHGGSIEIGRNEGQGTELVITLPRADAGSPSAAPTNHLGGDYVATA